MKLPCLVFTFMLLSACMSAADVSVGMGWQVVDGGDTSFSVDAGTDRVLVIMTAIEMGGTQTVESVTFGGVDMTLVIKSEVVQGNVTQSVGAFVLIDTDIPSGTQAVVVSFSATAPDTSLAYAMFENVDQTTPISDTISDQSGSGTSLNVTVTTVAGGLAFFGVNHKTGGASWTWVGPTEQFDFSADAFQWSAAHDLHASGGTLNGQATTTGGNGRIVIFGVELAPVAGPPAEQVGRRRKISQEN